MRRLAVVIAAVALLGAACSDDGEGEGAGASADPTTTTLPPYEPTFEPGPCDADRCAAR